MSAQCVMDSHKIVVTLSQIMLTPRHNCGIVYSWLAMTPAGNGEPHMTTGYIYNAESKIVLAKITSTNSSKIDEFAALNYSDDEYGLTYSPAFGAVDGLVDDGTADECDLDNDQGK